MENFPDYAEYFNDASDVGEINEEYEAGKDKAPFSYEYAILHSLESNSLTVEWLPGSTKGENEDCSVHRLILGTNADREQNQLLIASVELKDGVDCEETQYDFEEDEQAGLGPLFGNFEIVVRINHEGEVKRARYMPKNPCVIATKTRSREVLVFDFTRHPSPGPTGKCHPELRLWGHQQQGWALSWHPTKTELLSGSDDATICLWDINATPQHRRVIYAKTTFTGHRGVVGDVAWHPVHKDIFASVGYDKKLMVWDTRNRNTWKPSYTVQAHTADVHCLNFSSFSGFLLATGSEDKTVALWDLRKLNSKLHSFEFHTDEIYQVLWSPHKQNIFASAGTDKQLCVWDCSKIGEEQGPDRVEPPELIFVDDEHGDVIWDFSWNPNNMWTFCSVDENKTFQLWQLNTKDQDLQTPDVPLTG